MLKKIAVISFILLASLVSLAFAQDAPVPTQREWNIHYDYIEKLDGLIMGDDDVFHRAVNQVAVDHGITNDELYAIEEKVDNYGLTSEEQQILQEVDNELAKFGPERTREQVRAVDAQVARKYGITMARMADINARSLGPIFGDEY